MISAKVIADSKNEFGNRITTMVVTMPRIILAEFNTHRMFSRNSASSRAIPFEKMVKAVEENPFIPIAWQKDHKGMQGTEYFTDGDLLTLYAEPGSNKHTTTTPETFKAVWLNAKDSALRHAKYLAENKLTKQLANRLLEPFMWHTVICTATEWENFFALRCPQYKWNSKTYRSFKDLSNEKGGSSEEYSHWTLFDKLKINKGQAEIHMMALAEAMWDAYNESTSKKLKAGEWHIPFGDKIDIDQLGNYLTKNDIEFEWDQPNEDWCLTKAKIKIATARCARVSYTVVGEKGKQSNYEKDIELHDKLAASGHWSPFEHCAQAMSESEFEDYGTTQPDKLYSNGIKGECGWCGNFRGFIQYRKMFNNENVTI